MKVTITVPGKFHAFDLARELEKRNALERIITTYPRWKLKNESIPMGKITTMPSVEVLVRGVRAAPFIKKIWNPHFAASELFDKRAARCLGECDIVTAWAGYALHTIRKAKEGGIKTVLERGSSHILYQQSILKEEYESLGMKHNPPHPKVVLKEIREYEEADRIAIPSSFVERTFIENGVPPSKLIKIPYGVDLTLFHQIPKEDSVFRIICAGGMRVRKGVHYLLRAFAELKLPRSELLLIGSLDDEMKPFFNKHEGVFRWVGHIPRSELYRYFSQGSVFVLPSIEEGLALVQAQAMACGLPLIATEHTGAEDLIENGRGGFVIPIRDSAALKEKITFLYENPEARERMGAEAKERAKTFTWDVYGERIMQAYERFRSPSA